MALLALPAAPAGAAPVLQPVGTFDSPVHVAFAPGDDRPYVVEQEGLVHIAGRTEPFLDVRSITLAGGERGLLSIAFPPDHAQTGLFYAYLTARSPEGELQVREFHRTGDAADRGEGRLVIAQAHQQYPNHNGGQLQFGPDGRLWIGTGDGGSGNDPQDGGQRLNTLLGKVLRIDPRGAPYAVPPDNPFAGRTDVRPEIWASGLRNPWRFSFDRETGDLIVADVGQNAREEIDFAASADGRRPGANYGWRCYEGSLPTPGITPPCEPPGHVKPVHELLHADDACSITGGYVVRDPSLPSLYGRYLYGDLCLNRLRAVTLSATGASNDCAEPGLPVSNVSSFGQDGAGRVYVATTGGQVSRVVEGPGEPCAPPAAAPPGGPAPAPSPTATPAPPAAATCTVTAAFPRARRAASVLRDGLKVVLRAGTPCRVRLTGRRLRGADVTVSGRLVVRLRAAAALRRSLRRRGRDLTLRVTATPGGTARILIRRPAR